MDDNLNPKPTLQNQKSFYQPRPLEIIDTTLRDGQQTSLLHDHYKELKG